MFVTLIRCFLACAAVPALLLTGVIARAAEDPRLPSTLAWSAYNLGTTGYNQAVAIGKALKDRYGVNLRVIPGKNDISRLLPLRRGRVQFSANGVATYFAQEGVFQFAHPDWGPLPLRLVMSSNGESNQALAVAADTGVEQLADLRGKRVAWVRGAPSINVSTEAFLACGGLTWDDVTRVEFPGYNAMWNGVVNDQIDAAYANTVSGPTRKLEASPRGIRWPVVPHDDEACWQRFLAVAPYFTPHIATRGAAISADQPNEGATYPYPLLTVMADQDADLVGAVARAIHENFDAFKDADPGAIGWALSRQIFDWVVPYHEGAIAYWRSVGAWNEALDAHNDELLRRQAVLKTAWDSAVASAPDDEDQFEAHWLATRAAALSAAGFDPIWR